MYFDLHVPCCNCPFLRKGGIRLTKPRVKQITRDILSDQGGVCKRPEREHSSCPAKVEQN